VSLHECDLCVDVRVCTSDTPTACLISHLYTVWCVCVCLCVCVCVCVCVLVCVCV
jgi:hypothetical protein